MFHLIIMRYLWYAWAYRPSHREMNFSSIFSCFLTFSFSSCNNFLDRKKVCFWFGIFSDSRVKQTSVWVIIPNTSILNLIALWISTSIPRWLSLPYHSGSSPSHSFVLSIAGWMPFLANWRGQMPLSANYLRLLRLQLSCKLWRECFPAET